MGTKICKQECVIPFDAACQLASADCTRHVPNGVRRLPPQLACIRGDHCLYAHSCDKRNPEMMFPDLNNNIFVDSAAWEEGFGDVYVTKHHADFNDAPDRPIFIDDQAETLAYHLSVEVIIKGPSDCMCSLKLSDGSAIGEIYLKEEYRHYNFHINDDLVNCRELVMDFQGPPGKAVVDCEHGLLVGGTDLLAYVEGPAKNQASQGIFHIPNRYTCTSSIEIECQSFTGQEYICSFINGTRTPLEAHPVTVDPRKPFTFKYSLSPLCFPIISLEILLRYPSGVAGGLIVNKVLVNGNDCVFSTSHYPINGESSSSPRTLADTHKWTQSGWYRMMCYRRLNKRHTRISGSFVGISESFEYDSLKVSNISRNHI